MLYRPGSPSLRDAPEVHSCDEGEEERRRKPGPRTVLRNSLGSFTSKKRSANGTLSVHCLYATLGNTSSRCSAVSCARRAPYEGHHPLLLQLNAVNVDAAQSMHL